MDSSSTAIDSLSVVGNWCSIIGLLISIGTVIVTVIINKKVQELKNNMLFNVRVEEHLEKLTIVKSNYLNALKDTENYIVIRSRLKEIETAIQFVLKIVPKEIKSDGKEIIKVISYQYKNIGILKSDGWNKTKKISDNELWQTYDSVVAIIDKITSFNKDKNVCR